MLARKALAGTAAAPKVYVEDVFSTYLYTGTGSSLTITNNVDLSGKGGLLWIKNRGDGGQSHVLVDSVRGTTKALCTSASAAQQTLSGGSVTFNNNGFNISAGVFSGEGNTNANTNTYASWTFRKAEKFFDVVTYTGNGSTSRTIAHNLGSVPGCIIVKRTDAATNWAVYHRSIGATNALILQGTNAQFSSDWFGVTPTSSNFYLSDSDTAVNANGGTYVAYLFAHDAGGFGDAGTDNVISCGSFTTDGTGNFSAVNLGYEPQWILVKRSSAVDDWFLIDNMRGWTAKAGNNQILRANTSAAENASNIVSITSTGFGPHSDYAVETSSDYIYIAIRRGPMKTPETGTSVYYAQAAQDVNQQITTDFPVDMVIDRWAFWNDSQVAQIGSFYVYDRLRGSPLNMRTNSTAAETESQPSLFVTTTGFQSNTRLGIGPADGSLGNWYAFFWMFRRAPGFFDVVATDVFNTGTNVNHNLGVTPELVIAKARNNSGGNWMGAFKDGTSVKNISLNVTTAAYDPSLTWSDYFTSTTFNPTGIKNAAGGGVYGTSSPTVIYLFASLSGVSKVGTYTGNGSSVTVTTNFQPRFILVKRTDSTGDWIVSDSARGLVAGNDPYLELNTTDAEVTNEDWVDITSTSFTVNQTTNNANVNTGTYIYLAIA